MKRLLVAVALFVVAMLILRRLAGALAPPGRDRAAAGRRPARTTELVRDRVCNTFIPRDRALEASASGQTHYFCSEPCRSRFLAAGSAGAAAAGLAS